MVYTIISSVSVSHLELSLARWAAYKLINKYMGEGDQSQKLKIIFIFPLEGFHPHLLGNHFSLGCLIPCFSSAFFIPFNRSTKYMKVHLLHLENIATVIQSMVVMMIVLKNFNIVLTFVSFESF